MFTRIEGITPLAPGYHLSQAQCTLARSFNFAYLLERNAYLCIRIMVKSERIPTIRKHLLWEYEWESFDFSRLATVVIERVIERGNPFEWQEIVNFYGVEKISGIAKKSSRLDRKHKNFTRVYLQSGFIHDLQRPESHTS